MDSVNQPTMVGKVDAIRTRPLPQRDQTMLRYVAKGRPRQKLRRRAIAGFALLTEFWHKREAANDRRCVPLLRRHLNRVGQRRAVRGPVGHQVDALVDEIGRR